MLQKELTKIKYAAIEVIKNSGKSADDIECGAVIGICRRKDDKGVKIPFLAVVNSPNSIRLYNANEYKIVTLDILDDTTRYMTVFTSTLDDQSAAIQMIDQLVEQMAEADRLMPNDTHKELIDVEKYVDMPDAVLEGNNLSDTKKKKDTSSSHSSSYTPGRTTTHTTYVKKEPTISNIKRKGKLPSPDRLIAMREKVMQLATGVFLLDPLPVLKCDIEDAAVAESERKKKSWTA